MSLLYTYSHWLSSGGYWFCCPFLKEAHHPDSPWPFIRALTDRQHSPRWKAHRKGRETAGSGRYGYTHIHTKKMRLEKPMNLKHDKRARSLLPGELPCLGKQAPALARRETCQGLICVFVHRCASKRTRTCHMTIRKELLWNNSTFSE